MRACEFNPGSFYFLVLKIPDRHNFLSSLEYIIANKFAFKNCGFFFSFGVIGVIICRTMKVIHSYS